MVLVVYKFLFELGLLMSKFRSYNFTKVDQGNGVGFLSFFSVFILYFMSTYNY